MDNARINQIFDAAHGKRVLCIGDVMLDRFVHGAVTRISPEAPVAILKSIRDTAMPGGVANVARNLVSLGLGASLVGVIGADTEGAALVGLIVGDGMSTAGIVRDNSRPTTLKTRFVAGGQQLLRVDAEATGPVDPPIEAALVKAIQQAATGAALILISDYAKGAVTPPVIAAALAAGAAHDIPVIADPKGRDFARYRGVDLLKPNASELGAALDMAWRTDQDTAAALMAAQAQFGARAIVVTRAAKGMSFLPVTGGVQHRAGRAREVYDVSGAGDTSLAALALGMLGGGELDEAVELALAASGIVVAKAGTATVSRSELMAAMTEGRAAAGATYIEWDAARGLAAGWREAGLSVGFTNGCFDILHPGHLKVLEAAKARCARLIVGINSDASVARLKGPARPINSADARARVLAALAAVDAVVVFDEDTPLALITALQPDLLVKGGDYSPETIVGADVVLARGGAVHIVPTLAGHSTTATIARADRGTKT
jgi:D-beta-D-heptose 7-phosphate kinase / D-beta-D-heptose 1-phosphate adenosyltransferase